MSNIKKINGFWYEIDEEDTYRETKVLLSIEIQNELNK